MKMLMCYNKYMYNSVKESLIAWNTNTSDRDKLQHTFLTISVVLLVAAGVIGLLNQGLGQQILAVSIAAAGVFLVNAVVWALLQSSVLIRLNDKEMSSTVNAAAASKPRKVSRK